MRRTPLRRLGLVFAAVTITTLGLSVPAQAEPDTGTIKGHLTSNGQPVAGVQVDTYGDSWGSALTDAAGAYEITGLSPGPYGVVFRAPGRPEQFAYGATDWSSAAEIPVTAGGVTTVDDELLPYATFTGRFTDAAGEGLSVNVSAISDTGQTSGVWAGDGTYTLGVFPGRYRLQFMRDFEQPQWAPGARSAEDAAVFEISAGQTVTVNETQLPVGSVAGQITTADGAPAPGVRVELVDRDGMGGPLAITDQDGRYRIIDFGGAWRLRVARENGLVQWYPNTWHEQDAATVTVTPGVVLPIDQQLLATGSMSGHFTDAAGAGLGGVQVGLTLPNGDSTGQWTYTGEDGGYTFPELAPGGYVVRFDGAHGVDQYAHGKVTEAAADRITVTAGQNAVVDDVRLPVGSVTLRARDAITGQPIEQFYASFGAQSPNAENGVISLPAVRADTYQANIFANGYLTTSATITVTAGAETSLTFDLTPMARLHTTVVDRTTGQPLAGVCVLALDLVAPTIGDGCQQTDASGVVDVPVEAGKRQLFAFPDGAEGYGAQWVGRNGGTGAQPRAQVFTFTAGTVTTAPTIRMDRAGVISGTVTSETGRLPGGTIWVVDEAYNTGGGFGYANFEADGRYTIDFLGPYEWPLLFKVDGHAPQWSGTTGNRLLADKVKVKAGSTTRYDYRVVQGTAVTVKMPGKLGNGYVAMENAVTGDFSGGVWSEDSFEHGATFRVLGPQLVRVRWNEGPEWHWYGGVDREHAKTVLVPATASKVFVLR
ncbi:hypothetical protein Cci01nite_66410 [Catellatospora citrea]|uniref:alpha-amylase n=1 Tax=Catellatospora citrea TaxID=53366 RepID=A0A8J3P2M3_9ACTN|nr:carboxypeptidase family protein [Catellatospora citrea]GIG01548.1 hypothetical protein Cci01nite_66410 [Catellatospora citrea]